MKLQTLKPRVQAMRGRLSPSAVEAPRLRGRRGMERRARWLREHPLCEHCEGRNVVTAATEVDHVTPLWRGGADDESNLSSLCTSCHAAKTGKEAAERANGQVTAR